ncbi:hypothetical protein FF098_015930 [Parvularcula flava]|uniref:Uncharacterized protein n=1 Tax=Aquisalinus luteolus TaxID=1566827 RepID=A0A8J3EVX9_9PROT|nr:hypothetical protein [Aquisalinus luteolus]NHK29405.1 hypothetical protein [Aquisalinus luteolus]GGI02049.1 hypothetical protein GCM10011355_34140 [Aquisalinus luteolus]
MSEDVPFRHAKNDNSVLNLVADQTFSPEDISRALTEFTQRLEDEGASQALLIDALFAIILDTAYRASIEQTEDTTGFLVLERYNQLSHRTGELELLKAEMMKLCCHQIVGG